MPPVQTPFEFSSTTPALDNLNAYRKSVGKPFKGINDPDELYTRAPKDTWGRALGPNLPNAAPIPRAMGGPVAGEEDQFGWGQIHRTPDGAPIHERFANVFPTHYEDKFQQASHEWGQKTNADNEQRNRSALDAMKAIREKQWMQRHGAGTDIEPDKDPTQNDMGFSGTSRMNILRRRNGGSVNGDDDLIQLYRVGEAGIEMYKPKDGVPEMIGVNGEEVRAFPKDGEIIPNHDLHKELGGKAAQAIDGALPREDGGMVEKYRRKIIPARYGNDNVDGLTDGGRFRSPEAAMRHGYSGASIPNLHQDLDSDMDWLYANDANRGGVDRENALNESEARKAAVTAIGPDGLPGLGQNPPIHFNTQKHLHSWDAPARPMNDPREMQRLQEINAATMPSFLDPKYMGDGSNMPRRTWASAPKDDAEADARSAQLESDKTMDPHAQMNSLIEKYRRKAALASTGMANANLAKSNWDKADADEAAHPAQYLIPSDQPPIPASLIPDMGDYDPAMAFYNANESLINKAKMAAKAKIAAQAANAPALREKRKADIYLQEQINRARGGY